ncbi:myosin light chain kinase [Thraustotheca clavata]|uniref:Myosin light chain kinase n=1 Tax=Thraustotheca clavata TaxID=74557 RepID=A0A1W0ABA0_9STRA|nr:myosin light chain kinase [Thraustotheca clavata]
MSPKNASRSRKLFVMKGFQSERSLQGHPNIISLLDNFYDGKHLSLVMDVAEHGNLNSYMETHGVLSEIAVKHIARQLLSGIQACHAKYIIHRDIKLENILITAMNGDMPTVQIADFGLLTNAHPLSHCCGIPFCMAPEVVSGNLYAIYCLLTDEIPQAGFLDELDFSGMTKAANDFILAMLQENPHKRATANTLLTLTWFMDQSELTEFV